MALHQYYACHESVKESHRRSTGEYSLNIMKTISLAVVLSASMATTAMAELPLVSDARIIQPPPGASVAAAYFTVKNPGTEPLVITDASGDIAKRVEVHLSFVENDVAKMQQQESVTVEPGESLEFTHGSFHVMLMGLNEKLVAGNSIDLQLTTSAGEIDISVPILSLDQATTTGGMKHEMGESMEGMEHEMTEPMDGMEHDMKEGMKHDTK